MARKAKSLRKKPFRLTARDLKSEEGVLCLQALLGRYGYLTGAYCPGTYDESTRRAMAQFQSFYGLYPDEDGMCDATSLALLNTPRCGNGDPSRGYRCGSTGRLAAYVVGGKWEKTDLPYQFLNSTGDLTVARQRTIIREAFSRWSDVSALKFTQVSQNADITIGFFRGSHGDGYSFDDGGRPDGNTLAHAFFPPVGMLHFDEYELWKDQSGGVGTRLYNVALHEIGHILGLDHSQDTNAIMYAYYSESRNDLRADDIAGIQSLYGAAEPDPVAISPGERVSGTLPKSKAKLHYQVTLQNKLLLKLDGPSGTDFDLYVRHGQPAGTKQGEYDYVSWSYSSDEFIAIEDPKPGTYYILVHSYDGTGPFDLELELA